MAGSPHLVHLIYCLLSLVTSESASNVEFYFIMGIVVEMLGGTCYISFWRSEIYLEKQILIFTAVTYSIELVDVKVVFTVFYIFLHKLLEHS